MASIATDPGLLSPEPAGPACRAHVGWSVVTSPTHERAAQPGGPDQNRPTATGADVRRGPFREGDKVQLTDPKGRMHTITLKPGATFHTHKGYFKHEELLGRPEGWVVTNTAEVEYLALRPLLNDYVLSMPRGAAVVYPKDAGQIVTMADIFPGARVVEAGVGSGGLTLSLLRAVGDTGELHSIERREDFAAIASGNVETFFGGPHPAWHLHTGDLAERLPDVAGPGTVDRVVLDMLAPWENLDVVADALVPGGVLICYVATATQLSRTAEDLRAGGRFAEPSAFETIVRGWHLEGLAVRPQHRMVGHTGFLITARRLADGVAPPERRRRPAKGAKTVRATADGAAADQAVDAGWADEWTDDVLGEREVSAKKIRRVRREVGKPEE
ncbi:hypothetical protein GCM10028784_23940 [Myceligenerans cantabricum]